MSKILSGKELYDRLITTGWKQILPKLHYYALNKLQRYTVLREKYEVTSLAKELADKAVELVWKEQRKWNTQYYPDIYDLLKGIVDSLVSNFVQSKVVEITEAFPEGDLADFGPESTNDPESLYILKETEAEIMALLRTDEKATQLFECLKDGLKPAEIATELGWEVGEVYNTMKRVQRKLYAYKEKNR